MVDGQGVMVYSYEGRVLSQSKFNFSLGSLQSAQLGMNASYWLVVDPRDQKHIIGGVIKKNLEFSKIKI